MVEVELKFEITKAEIDSLIKKIMAMGFILGESKYEKTVMYDNPGSLMQISDGRVRLRKIGKETEFSYKKPITRNGIKREIEYEVTTSNFDTTEKILKNMDFLPVSSYERYRTTGYNRDNTVKVTLDEFPFANFVEIEGEEKEILKLADKLDLNRGKNITKSCDTLFQEWRKRKGLPFAPHMLFDGFDK